MFQDVMNYKPKEQDYRIWLVLNPAVWLMPILLAVGVIALLVHAFLFTAGPYGEYWVGDAAPVAVEAAPAPAVE